jgi:hypothetical protein
MHGVLASCLVSCATTIAVNLLIRRRRPQTAASPQQAREAQQAPCEPAGRDECVDDIKAAVGCDQDAKGIASSVQQPAAQDDDFCFTPHKAKPARWGEHLAPFALQSPINVTKRADPYDPAPRSG